MTVGREQEAGRALSMAYGAQRGGGVRGGIEEDGWLLPSEVLLYFLPNWAAAVQNSVGPRDTVYSRSELLTMAVIV